FTFSESFEDYDPGWAPVTATEQGKLVLLSGLAKLREDAPPIPKTPTVGTLKSHPAGGLQAFAGYHSRGQVRFNIKRDGSLYVEHFGRDLRVGWLLTSSMLFATRGTQPLPLAADFRNYGKADYADASIATEGDLVVLAGLAVSSEYEPGRVIAVVPPAYRPSQDLVFRVNAHKGSARVDVRSNGEVTFYAGAPPGWVSLSNIAWSLDPDAGLTFNGDYIDYGANVDSRYAGPSVEKVGDIVVVTGMVQRAAGKDVTANQLIATLPAGYRPAKPHMFYLNAHDQHVLVYVETNGEIRVRPEKTGYWDSKYRWISLSGISFPTN
ncbi:MAG: hypothetical protein KC457_20755, partial [Myxococcales bacterium]|nr:hypothetical protein [Myxococcales bacterium]